MSCNCSGKAGSTFEVQTPGQAPRAYLTRTEAIAAVASNGGTGTIVKVPAAS